MTKRDFSPGSSDEKADITLLTNQIDQLVYELYGLTEEEISIIENSIK